MKKQIEGFKEVFSKSKYIFLTLFVALLFYLLNVVISDFFELTEIFRNYSFIVFLKLSFFYFIGFPSTISFFSAISMLFIALLFGSYISLAIYKTKQIKKFETKTSFAGSVGVFLGVFAPGCAACGIGVASLFGLGGLISFLPYDGFEISVIALIFLLYANFSIAKKINQNTCSIKIKHF